MNLHHGQYETEERVQLFVARYVMRSTRENRGLPLPRFAPSFTTTLVQGGIELYKVQQLLRHKSSTMTQRYGHHYLESFQNEVEVLDRMRGAMANLAQSAGLEEGLNC